MVKRANAERCRPPNDRPMPITTDPHLGEGEGELLGPRGMRGPVSASVSITKSGKPRHGASVWETCIVRVHVPAACGLRGRVVGRVPQAGSERGLAAGSGPS